MLDTDEIVYDTPELSQWIFRTMGYGFYGYQCIGLKRRGEFVVGVLCDRFNLVECQIHIVAKPGVRWATPELCRIAFRYPFIRLARRRITAETAASNIPMLRIQRRLGFVQEGVKRGAAMDGGDAIIFGMLRDECRWLEVSP
jgi:RimJ/RimL family protein N-acetyltransferase